MSDPKTPQELTKKGNVKRPSYALVAEWCLKAWEQLPTEQIIKSFVDCNCGKFRDDSLLHSRLKNLVSEDSSESTQAEEHSGLTDNESGVEELDHIVDGLDEILLDD